MRFFRRKNWEEELSAYLDGELSEADRGELEALLRERPELRVRLEELRGLKSLFSTAAREQSPLDLWPGV
ncbi:MAG: anti-sigma factor family protein, partial [Nitrospinota bacterium]